MAKRRKKTSSGCTVSIGEGKLKSSIVIDCNTRKDMKRTMRMVRKAIVWH